MRPEKYTLFQPHVCIWLYNGSYTPPPPWIKIKNTEIEMFIPIHAHYTWGKLLSGTHLL